jgi:single-strand DNA-binding protein
MRVIVTGRLKQRNYETKEGEKRTVYEVEVDDVGPSLRNASAKVNRASRGSGEGGFSGGNNNNRGSGGQGSSSGGSSRNEDPWASDSAGYSDEPPF